MHECTAYIADMSCDDPKRARHRQRQAAYEARLNLSERGRRQRLEKQLSGSSERRRPPKRLATIPREADDHSRAWRQQVHRRMAEPWTDLLSWKRS